MARGLRVQAQVDSNSSLVLRPLTKEAHGRWECSASNAVARVATFTNVYVLGECLVGNQDWWGRGDRVGQGGQGCLTSLPPSIPLSRPGTSPHVVTNVSVVPVPKGANVSWEPGFDGGYLQRFSVWYTPL